MRFELAPFALPAGYGDAIVPLADVKRHLAIELAETEFDELLPVLRDAAVDMVERYCNLILGERTGMVWTSEKLPRPLRLGVSPVTSLTSATYLDANGDEQEIDVATLRIGIRGEVLVLPGEMWPSDVKAALTITFDAGHSATTRPPALIHAVKLFAAHLFANREAVATGAIATEIPLGFQRLCSAYRMPVV